MQSEYIKGPINYAGGKHKLLNEILPKFPKNINVFVDLFCGACNVSINVEANTIICNDFQTELINLYKNFYFNSTNLCLNKIKETINKYNLSKYNKEGFLDIRKDYNIGNKEWYMFYTMVVHSFNHQIRFNKKGEYNNTSGCGKNYFNSRIENNLIIFANKIKEKNIIFKNDDFRNIDLNTLNEKDFVYIDPPYINTDATYNRFWTTKEELDLYSIIKDLDNRNIKFGLSNLNTNSLLIDFCKKNKYNITYLDFSYSNCFYNKKNNIKKEIFITNY